MNNLEPEKNNEQKDENLLDEKKQQNNEENENNDKAVEKLPCEVVEDLLPLYEEKLVGEATAKLIENHAQTSPSCRKKLFAHKAQEELPCETIGDLLSLYSEGLTGEVTTKLIEKHLKTCPKCAKKLSFLQNKQNEDKEKALEAYIGENPIDMKELTVKKKLMGNLKSNHNNAKPSALGQAVPLKKMKKELSRRRRNAVFLAMSLILLAVAIVSPVFTKDYYLSYQEGLITASKDEEGSLVIEHNSQTPISGYSSWHDESENQMVFYIAVLADRGDLRGEMQREFLVFFNRDELFSDERLNDDRDETTFNLSPFLEEGEGDQLIEEGHGRETDMIPDSVVYVDLANRQFYHLYGKEVADYDEEIFVQYRNNFTEIKSARIFALIAGATGLVWLFLNLLYKYKAAVIFKYLCLGSFSAFSGLVISSMIRSIFGLFTVDAFSIVFISISIFGVLVFGLALLKQYREDRKA